MKMGYARVSSGEQNLDLQRDALRAAGCSMIHEDEGVSGAVRRRPGLDQALATMKAGDALVTWRLDRLGRSLPHLIELVAALQAKGCEFVSLSEAIDSTSAGGKLIFHIMGALAGFERALIVERTRAGMASARARGRHLGRPIKLTGAQIRKAEEEIGADRETVSSMATLFGVNRLRCGGPCAIVPEQPDKARDSRHERQNVGGQRNDGSKDCLAVSGRDD